MLEEAFKTIEDPVTQRLTHERSLARPGVVYSSCNLAYESKQSAAAEVLYLDTLITEDARVHSLPFARVPADFEKFFNAISLHQVDAVQQAHGARDAVHTLYQAAFQGFTLRSRAGGGSHLTWSAIVVCRKA